MYKRELYPKDWKKISLSVREQAGWKCQKCGKDCRMPKEPIQAYINRTGFEDARFKPIRYCLTTAHLNRIPADCRLTNLMAMCAPCHLRYDAPQHARSRKTNERERLERMGQLTLPIRT